MGRPKKMENGGGDFQHIIKLIRMPCLLNVKFINVSDVTQSLCNWSKLNCR